jgi:hypothetical protein
MRRPGFAFAIRGPKERWAEVVDYPIHAVVSFAKLLLPWRSLPQFCERKWQSGNSLGIIARIFARIATYRRRSY